MSPVSDSALSSGMSPSLTWVQDLFALSEEKGVRTSSLFMQAELQKHYELTCQVLGPQHESVGTFLKRRIRWTNVGIEWTVDGKHAAALVRDWATPGGRKVNLAIGQ